MNRFVRVFVSRDGSLASRPLRHVRAAAILCGLLALGVATFHETHAEPAGNLVTPTHHSAISGGTPNELLVQLTDPSAARRREALLRLADQEVDSEIVITHVWPLLDDSDPFVQVQAARAVWLLGRRPDVAAGTLSGLLDPHQPQLCALASFLVGEIGPAARQALPALRARITESDPVLQLHAAEAITKIDPADSVPP
jgi:hypothetical protein